MKCPYCGYRESKVVDSRPADEGNSIRRRRECLACERRFTTFETMESLPMVVSSMLRACEKRTVPLARLEELTDEIEQNLQNCLEREITTDMIGEQVMDKLRGVDEVAYVRFASVYRQFKDIPTFMEELTKLLEER